MFYRVLKAHEFTDQHGRKVRKEPGCIVEVMQRAVAATLLQAGVIGSRDRTHVPSFLSGDPAPPFSPTVRVGFFIATSSWYSGGRLHMYQFALCLARAGAEVFIVTDRYPAWASDYPECGRLAVVIDGHDPVPPDLDVAVTDSKGAFGERALAYRREHPWCVLACFNFETPNWVEKYVPDYAKSLGQEQGVFREADILMANSAESALWLNRWLRRHDDDFVAVLPPAVNTFALESAEGAGQPERERPYAVWSARSPAYKGGDVAIAAVRSLPFPFDLLMIGQPRETPPESELHSFEPLKRISDEEKLALMRGATCVLAPSLFEGAGMVPMEALACGAPCVVYE
ncbi:MAG: glycosyltransferase, partial [Armatimonadia bacterium]|nr:glycosyltransferase [Armatimonadia bacterium]